MIVLVTGASSGLGRALAHQFLQQGYTVYGTSRREQPDENGLRMLQMDVQDARSVEQAIGQIKAREGRLDILVNNAGLGIAGPLEETRLDYAQQVVDTNVLGFLRLLRAVLPLMREQNSGKVINISSIGARFGLPFRGIYCASKSALDIMMEALRYEVEPYGIQSCCIHAGDIRTPINQHRLQSYDPSGSYVRRFTKVYQMIDEEVENGLPAAQVAEKIVKIAAKKRLKPYYAVGKPLQRLSLTLKKILPDAWFERLLRQYSEG